MEGSKTNKHHLPKKKKNLQNRKKQNSRRLIQGQHQASAEPVAWRNRPLEPLNPRNNNL
jgi:hypothetical protein